jgi:8-oxo-dGTP diphosphatase
MGASCHDAAQLARAAHLGADFATLSPVTAITAVTRPQVTPLGWSLFHPLAEAAALPVYALGGMAPAHIAQARQSSGQGAAGSHGFWPLQDA